MKKSIYISGVIIINVLLAGCIFKINHWPGAGILLTLSLVSLVFWFLPASLINNFKGRENRDKKWLYIATFITFFIVFLGVLFKVQHWPGASWFLLIGVPIPFLVFLPVYLYHNARDPEESPTNFIAIILGLTFIAVFSVLLAVNVSKSVLYSGISLIKTNENVIDFYENKIENLLIDILANDIKLQKHIEEISNLSNEICNLIRRAEKQILNFTDNASIADDLGNEEFNIHNLVNKENASAQYFLLWQENAWASKIKDKTIELEKLIHSANLSKELNNAIGGLINLDNENMGSYESSWELREFSSDYMIYALESLSRWEKNIRFIESEVLAELIINEAGSDL